METGTEIYQAPNVLEDFSVCNSDDNEIRLSDLGKIELYLISNGGEKNYALWKDMMQTYHYLQSSILFGRQLKYLIISSNFGCIGGMGFSSPAWSLECRDRLIGYAAKDRSYLLNYVVCNSRFLILPWIKVKNLASHVLSLSLSHLKKDWQRAYGYEPALVETFVDKSRYTGTCYKAANWVYVGTTKGRGRVDCLHEHSLSIKDIYVYELRRGFCRGYLCEPKVEDWIDREFKFADLPNLSRQKRLLLLARSFYAHPTGSIPVACGGIDSKAKIKGAYRFFSDDRIEMKNILRSHYQNTVLRAKKYPVVLAVQDSTSLNYATHPKTKGLGCLSSENREIGLMMHDTMAFTPEGVPLGLLDVDIWARNPKEYGKKKYRKTKPIEEKESMKWLNSFNSVEKLSKSASQTQWVSVGDRESDVYELFDLACSSSCELLIRATQNRKTKEEKLLWDLLAEQKSVGSIVVHLPKSKKRKERDATLEIRFKKVEIIKSRSKDTASLWAIYAKEIGVSEEQNPVSWKLLTTLEVNDFEQACEKVEWYSKRWGVEVFHKTLKSGCKVENRQFGDAENIKRCLAIDLVIAWRIYYLTTQGRQTPEVDCGAFLEELEWKTLMHYKTKSPLPPDKSPTLIEAITLIAKLGGYVERKGRHPGVQVIWRGLIKLHNMIEMYAILTQSSYESELKQIIAFEVDDDFG